MIPAKHLMDEDGNHDPACFACKVRTISFAASAMPTRSPDAARAKMKDPELQKNLDAYRRLRMDGTQPKSIHTAAKMEAQATEKWEVETGRIVPDERERQRYTEAFDFFPKPCSDPIVREPA